MADPLPKNPSNLPVATFAGPTTATATTSSPISIPAPAPPVVATSGFSQPVTPGVPFNPSPVVATITTTTPAPTPPPKNLLPGVAVALFIATVILNVVLVIVNKISFSQGAAIASFATTALGIVKYIETILPTPPYK
jgi:hypothetical protein